MPSSSLFLRSSTTLISIVSLLSSTTSASPYPTPSSGSPWVLDTQYSGASFFDGFNFFDQADPTHGFVTYVNKTTAQNKGLIESGGFQDAKLRVDANNTYDYTQPYYNVNGVGRPSVRIESQKSWTHGLFIADIKHMPGGICGTWPAFWAIGSGVWPNTGEVDILEGSNAQTTNLYSAHTGNSCNINSIPTSDFSATVQSASCNLNDNSGTNYVGCGFQDTNTNSYGSSFNSNGGGYYAMQWTSDNITIWFWTHAGAPSDIGSGSPDPTGWGLPSAVIANSECNIDGNFKDMRLVFDTTFCGDLGDATWGNSCQASTETQTCAKYVATNPGAFVDAYWQIASVKVFQSVTNSSSGSTSTSTSTSITTLTSTVPYGATAPANFTGPFGTTATANMTGPYVNATATSTATLISPTSTWAADGLNASASWQDDSANPTDTASVSWEDWSSNTVNPTDTATASWEDWSSATADGPIPTGDPTIATIATENSWEDWSSGTTAYTDESAMATGVPTGGEGEGDNWDSSNAAADDSSNPASGTSWADWSSGPTSTPVAPVSADSESWADWSSATAVNPDSATQTGSETWADWSSATTAAPVSADSSETWADWSATVAGSITVTVQPQSTDVGVAPVQQQPWAGSNSSSSNGTWSSSSWPAAYTGAATSIFGNVVESSAKVVVAFLGAMLLL